MVAVIVVMWSLKNCQLDQSKPGAAEGESADYLAGGRGQEAGERGG